MKLHVAKHYAEQIALWLGPYCHRVEIAGSVRRRRPECNDVDIVCIPRLVPGPVDLLGQEIGHPKSLLHEFLVGYVKEGRGSWRKPERKNRELGEPPATEPHPAAVNFFLTLNKKGVDLDIFAGKHSNFITRLICRTGSMLHNVNACERAKELGGHWNPQDGLTIDGKEVPLEREMDFYLALGWKYLEPEERE